MFAEIAADLASRVDRGRLLDIGTGPGRLLLEVYRLNPYIELFGLDISDAMVNLAKSNLSGIKVDLRQGSICKTAYEGDYFDIITCSGSFYLWDYPEECLEEIYRILKVGQSAYLFESYRDYERGEFRNALRTNLRGENLFRRLVSPVFLRKQLRMTYNIDEVAGIIRRTSFSDNHAIEKIVLAGLPIWLRIMLTKREGVKREVFD
jgi:ubiquinone/menaquinone biosynthesis C-methylase UbiE